MQSHARVSVGQIAQEQATGCVLFVEITRHSDEKCTARALGQVRLDQGSCEREAGGHWSLVWLQTVGLWQ